MNFFLVGLFFYSAYYFGIKLLDKDPNEIVKNYISKSTPQGINIVLQGITIAWFTHGFCTSRTVPGVDSTLEIFIEKTLFRNFRSDLIDDKNRGRQIFARKLLRKYNKKYGEALDRVTFARKIEAHITDNRLTIKPGDIAILQVLSEDMAKVSSLDTSIAFALENFTPKKIKLIIDL